MQIDNVLPYRANSRRVPWAMHIQFRCYSCTSIWIYLVSPRTVRKKNEVPAQPERYGRIVNNLLALNPNEIRLPPDRRLLWYVYSFPIEFRFRCVVLLHAFAGKIQSFLSDTIHHKRPRDNNSYRKMCWPFDTSLAQFRNPIEMLWELFRNAKENVNIKHHQN